MAFEKFTKTGRSYRPRVSIRSNGQIGFNYGAINRFSMDNYKYAILYFDRESNRIGIKLSSDEEDGILKLQIRRKNAAIAARSFLDYYSLDYSITKSYELFWDSQETMLVVYLDKELNKG